MPAEVVPLGVGHDPRDRSDRTFYVHISLLENVQDDVVWKYQDVPLLGSAVKALPPTVCFHGLRRAGFDDAYCYATKPVNPPQDGVLLVYFYEGPGGFAGPTVIDFEWRKEDEKFPCRPHGWERDLGELIWERQP
jgi:hypothetical protein